TVASRDRLVFRRDLSDIDIYRFQPGRSSEAVAASSFMDYLPTFSPGGRPIAFESGRTGEGDEICLAEADGSHPVLLTQAAGRWSYAGAPQFSPDGRSVAFDAIGDDGHSDIWTIAVDGGSLRRVTEGPEGTNDPLHQM